MQNILSLLEVKNQRQVVLWTMYASVFISLLALTLAHFIFGSLFPGSVYPTLSQIKAIAFPLTLGICLPNFYGMFCMSLRVSRKNEELRQLANHDPLTGILNRRAFAEQFQMAARKARRNQQNGVLMVIDIDHFKTINDTFGHETGDVVLVNLANQLLTLAGPEACVARLGGEEFAVLLFSGQELNYFDLAEKFRSSIELETISHGEKSIALTVSIGVSALHQDAVLADAMRQADSALYTAKREGRNQVIEFNPDTPALAPSSNDIDQIVWNKESSQLASKS